ncbi:MAG: small ribosomal subunit Rsm22 family protein [bacterium]
MLKEIALALEEAVEAEIKTDDKSLARAAKALSLAFTSDRETLPPCYIDDREALCAYAAAFLIPNAVKVAHALLQLDLPGLLLNKPRLKVLDLGAGPGTATLATAIALSRLRKNPSAEFLAVDRSRAALDLAGRLFKRVHAKGQVLETRAAPIEATGSLPAIGSRRFDLILAANVVNELASVEPPYRMLRLLFENYLNSDGAVVIIDPALRETSRSLMQLRDRLLADGVARVHAPCLHQGPCPMLAANARDWCHFYIDWERPKLIERIDALANMDRRHLKMSYLILRHCEEAVGRGARNDTWRAVSSPIVSKGKRELWLCGSNGELRRVRRTDRDASDANRDFDSVKRGDVVRCAACDRLGKDDVFSTAIRWRNT